MAGATHVRTVPTLSAMLQQNSADMDQLRASHICTPAPNAEPSATASTQIMPVDPRDQDIQQLRAELSQLKSDLQEAHGRASKVGECERRKGQIHNTLLRTAHDEALAAGRDLRQEVTELRSHLTRVTSEFAAYRAQADVQQRTVKAEAELLALELSKMRTMRILDRPFLPSLPSARTRAQSEKPDITRTLPLPAPSPAMTAKDTPPFHAAGAELLGARVDGDTSSVAGVHLAALRADLEAQDQLLAAALSTLASKQQWQRVAPKATIGAQTTLREIQQWSSDDASRHTGGQHALEHTEAKGDLKGEARGKHAKGGEGGEVSSEQTLARLERLEQVAHLAAERFDALQEEHTR